MDSLERAKQIKENSKNQGLDLSVEQIQHCIDNPDEKHTFNGNEDLEYCYLSYGLDHIIEVDKSQRKFLFNDVSFETLEEVLSIKKNNPEYTLEDAYENYHDSFDVEGYDYNPFRMEKEEIKKIWDSTEPATVEDIKERYPLNGEHFEPNEEKRKVALDFINKNL